MNILTKSRRTQGEPARLWPAQAQRRCAGLLEAGRARLAEAAGSIESWLALKADWSSFVRSYAESTRPDPMGALTAAVIQVSDHGDFRLENIRLASASGWQIGLNLFLPAGPGPHTPVLCPCGHGPKWQADHQIPPQVLARNGFAAALFDMPMFGERAGGNDHFVQGAQALMAGVWSNHYFLRDAVQAADYLQTRADIDFSRGMGVTGVSGGGFTTLFLAQLDARVAAIAPVCSLTSWLGHIVAGLYTGCPENYLRGQARLGLDLDHLACLAAPLPCLVIGGLRDELFLAGDMQRSVDQARRVYELLGAGDRLDSDMEDSAHHYTAGMAARTAGWFRRWLRNDAASGAASPGEAALLPPEALDCGTAEPSRSMHDDIRDRAARLKEQRTADVSDAALADVLGIPLEDAGGGGDVETVPLETPWHYPGLSWKIACAPGDLPLPMLDLDFPAAPPGTVVCFGDQGKLAPARMGAGLWELRRRVISADLRGFGELAPEPSPSDLYSWSAIDRAVSDLLLLCGESALGWQVRDALRVLTTALGTNQPIAEADGAIVYGRGEAALPALFAGLLHPGVSRIVLDAFPCSFGALAGAPTTDWSRYAFLPGVLAAFDLPDLFQHRADKQFLLIRPLDGRKQPVDEITALRLYGDDLPNVALRAPVDSVADLKSVIQDWLAQAPAAREPVDPVLALHGGRPVCAQALPSKWHGADLIGLAELAQLNAVVRARTPFRHYGPTSHIPRMAEALERRAAETFGVSYALAVSSGSAALACALAGLGIGPGDEVILPAFAWISCYNAIVLAGALPVFCDIDASLTIDPRDFERRITPATRAVLVVHYQGGAADMQAVLSIARRRGVKVLEDNAQSAGARYRGRRLGGLGDVGILSFQTAKVITSGEGGMVLTDDAVIFERAVRYHDLGFLRPVFDAQILNQSGAALSDEERARRQFNVDATFAGNQFRMNELSAAMALAQLERLDWINQRCHAAWDAIQRRVAAAEIGVTFRPANDYAGDAGIALFVDLGAPERAQAFKTALAAEIPNLGPSSHVSNLLAEEYVQARRMSHPALPPFGPGFNGEQVSYTRDLAPNADAMPARMVAIGIGPRYTRRDAEAIGDAIVKVYGGLFGSEE